MLAMKQQSPNHTCRRQQSHTSTVSRSFVPLGESVKSPTEGLTIESPAPCHVYSSTECRIRLKTSTSDWPLKKAMPSFWRFNQAEDRRCGVRWHRAWPAVWCNRQLPSRHLTLIKSKSVCAILSPCWI